MIIGCTPWGNRGNKAAAPPRHAAPPRSPGGTPNRSNPPSGVAGPHGRGSFHVLCPPAPPHRLPRMHAPRGPPQRHARRRGARAPPAAWLSPPGSPRSSPVAEGPWAPGPSRPPFAQARPEGPRMRRRRPLLVRGGASLLVLLLLPLPPVQGSHARAVGVVEVRAGRPGLTGGETVVALVTPPGGAAPCPPRGPPPARSPASGTPARAPLGEPAPRRGLAPRPTRAAPRPACMARPAPPARGAPAHGTFACGRRAREVAALRAGGCRPSCRRRGARGRKPRPRARRGRAGGRAAADPGAGRSIAKGGGRGPARGRGLSRRRSRAGRGGRTR